MRSKRIIFVFPFDSFFLSLRSLALFFLSLSLFSSPRSTSSHTLQNPPKTRIPSAGGLPCAMYQTPQGGPIYRLRTDLTSGSGGNFFSLSSSPSSSPTTSPTFSTSPTPPARGPQLSLWPALTTVVVATLTSTVLLMFLAASVMLVVSRKREGAEARERAAEAEAEAEAEAGASAARSSSSALASSRQRQPLPPLVEAPSGCRIVVHPDRKMALALPEEVV